MTAIKPRTARVTIYQGDDLARLSELDETVARTEAALRQAERAAKDASQQTRTLDEADDAAETLAAAREKYDAAVLERDAFAADAEGRGVVVVLHAQPRKEWRRLMAEHGPRDGVKDDEPLGVNMETLPDALLPVSIDRGASTIEGSVEDFLESLSDYDYYDRLFLQAFALNRGSATADPKARLRSSDSLTSGATSS